MRTTNILALALAAAAFCITTPASATPPSGREVLIDQARFAQLAPAEQAEVLALKVRIEELIATDRSTLTPEGRAAMRTEWKELKREMRAHNDGGRGHVIYLSTAAIIIIVLLLLILI